MDSFALAYIPTKKDKDYDFTGKVNINLWTQCGWKNDEPVLDIGLFISKLSAAQTIRLYVPFVVDMSNLEDLCECLSKDASLLGAVFNERIHLQTFQIKTKKRGYLKETIQK